MVNDTNGPKVSTKIWNRAFCSILLANAVINLCQYLTNALLPKYADSMGMQATTIGMLMSAYTFTSLILRFFAGPVLDTYNKKYIAAIAMIGLAVAYAGFGVSTSISTLVVFRLLQGVVMAFCNACCFAMASETIPKDKFASGIGYFSLGMVIGQALGPVVALELLGLMGYGATFLITAGFSVLAALLALWIKSNFTRTKKLVISFKNAIAVEAILPSVLLTFLYMVVFAVNSFLIVFAEKQGITQNIGIYFTVNALVMMLTRPLMGKLSDRHGSLKVLIPSLCFGIAALIVISVSNALWMFIAAAVLAAFGFGACVPLAQSLTMKSVTNERRGAASSTNYIFMDIGVLLGSNLSGVLVQAFGYTTMWNLMIVPLLLAMFAAVFARKTISRVEKSFRENTF